MAQIDVAAEARRQFAHAVQDSRMDLADYDRNPTRRAYWEQEVIRAASAAEATARNPGGQYTYVSDEGHRMTVERHLGMSRIAVINGSHAEAVGIIRVSPTAALGLAAALLTAAGYEHLATTINQGVNA